MTSSDDVLRILRTLRRRMLASLFFERLACGALTVGAALVLFGALNRWFFGDAPVRVTILVAAVFATFAFALAGLLMNIRSLAEVAQSIDTLGQTRDRFATALALSGQAVTARSMGALAERECCEFIGRSDFRRLVPVRLPALGAWLVVPLVALLLLQWEFSLASARRQAEVADAQAKLADTVQQLDRLAQQTEKKNEQANDGELKRLAEQLRQSAERLRTETSSDEAQKSAFRELSALEAAMKELQRQPSPAEEMRELAKALAAVPGMKDVLDALDRNHLAAAARALEEMQKQAAQELPRATDEQVRQALKQAMERLGEQRQLSEALQKLMDRLRQPGGQQGAISQAMQQLREMMHSMMREGGNPQQGGNPSQMTLQQLIAALQNMKFGDGQAPPGSDARSEGGAPQISMQSFGPPSAPGEPPVGQGNRPTGHPGSEHDFGTTDTPFGAKNRPSDKGLDGAAKGQLADGESLSMMLPTAGDASRSSRRYKELYEAMAPAAEDAVQQENIPLGSRFFIKRYFESIRPKD
jgi:hypothetical protein